MTRALSQRGPEGVVAGMETRASDPVNNPAHYQSATGLECIDAIRAALTPEEFRGYCKAAALKYIWREQLKGGDESLAKACWYLSAAQK